MAVIIPPTLMERLWQKIGPHTESGCWPWIGGRSSAGYGTFNLGGHYDFAHRILYRLLVGPIPDGLDLDHVCHTLDQECPGGSGCSHRACVNPSHLEPVTHQENIARGWRRTR